METKKLKSSLGYVKENIYHFKNDRQEGVFGCSKKNNAYFIVRIKKRFCNNPNSAGVILTLKKFTKEEDAILFYSSLTKSELYKTMHSITVSEFYAKLSVL